MSETDKTVRLYSMVATLLSTSAIMAVFIFFAEKFSHVDHGILVVLSALFAHETAWRSRDYFARRVKRSHEKRAS